MMADLMCLISFVRKWWWGKFTTQFYTCLHRSKPYQAIFQHPVNHSFSYLKNKFLILKGCEDGHGSKWALPGKVSGASRKVKHISQSWGKSSVHCKCWFFLLLPTTGKKQSNRAVLLQKASIIYASVIYA